MARAREVNERQPTRAWRWAVAVTAVIACAAVLLPFVPLDRHRARIEQEARERLGEPVSIGRLSAALLPLPHLTARHIEVGGDDAQVKAGVVIVRPRLGTLLSSEKVMRAIEMRDVEARQKALLRLVALAGARGGGRAPLRVEKLVFENILVRTAKDAIGPFAAEVELGAAGAARRAALRTADGSLRVDLVPEGGRYAISVEAKDWTLPWGAPLEFDRLRMTGRAAGGSARFEDVVAVAYGGQARGELRIAWEDGFEIAGTLTLENVALARLVGAFEKRSPVTGRLDAKPVFRARAREVADLGESLRLEGPFRIHDAVLRGIDLQAVASLTRRDAKTGDTRFDELSGTLALERGAYRFTRLKAASGALSARGEITVAKRALSGRVHARMAAIGRAAEVPLEVSGTLDAPSVMPSGAAIAGAAVGTAVLGPGVGTTVGAKLGELAEEVLGGGKPRDRD